jgi:hypothetical protein
MPPLREVAVLVDDSPHSAHAWAWAADALLPCLAAGARVRLLCIAVPSLEPELDADAAWAIPADSDARREEERAALEAASGTLRRLAAAHAPPQGVDLRLQAARMVGSVGETVAALLREQPADVCVVGSRGMGTFKRCAMRIAGARAAAALTHRMRRAACWPASRTRSRLASWAPSAATACACARASRMRHPACRRSLHALPAGRGAC